MHKVTLATLLLAITLTSCFSMFGDPSSTVMRTVTNSAQTKKAVLLRENGNATVGFSLQVSVLENDYVFSGKEIGNTFSVDGDHGAARLDSASVTTRWLGNDTLQIDYDKNLRTFTQEKNIDGVTIIYKTR